MGNAAGLVRWGYGGAVAIGTFTAANQTSPMSGFLDARSFGKWNFNLKGSITAGGVTVQGTLDGGSTWFDLSPDSSSTSTGANVNPLAGLDAQLKYNGVLMGVRGVSNGTFAGACVLEGAATP